MDMDNIKLALQSYNYGNGYLEWAKARGGYTLANAAEFSDTMAKKMGWSSYGEVPKFSLCSDGVLWFKSKSKWQNGGPAPAPGMIIFFRLGLRWNLRPCRNRRKMRRWTSLHN